MLTPEGAAEYAAGIVRRAQDAYQSRGIDISGRPELLATLYNLGDYDRRAERAQLNGETPKVNFFGFFVQENLQRVQETIGWEPGRGRIPRRRDVELEVGASGLFRQSTPRVYASPIDCSSRGRGQSGEMNARISRIEYPQIGVRGTSFRVLDRFVDCEMRDWSLIRTNTGAMGWVKNDDLLAAAGRSDRQLNLNCTQNSQTNRCLSEVARQYGDDFIERDTRSGIYYLPVKRHDANDPVNTSKTDNMACQESSYENLKQNGLSGGTPAGPPHQNLTQKQVEETKAKVRAIKRRIQQALGLQNFNDRSNPYQTSINNIEQRLSRCTSNTQCRAIGLDGLTRLESVNFANIRSFGEYQRITGILSSVHIDQAPVYMNPAPPTPEQIEAFASAREAMLRSCSSTLAELGMQQEFQRITEDSNSDQLPKAMVMPVVNQLRMTCESLGRLRHFQRTGERTWADDETCMIQTRFQSAYFGQTFTSVEMSLDAIVSLNLSEDDLRTALRDLIPNFRGLFQTQSIGQMMGGGIGFGGITREDLLASCNYRPLETVRSVERLLGLSCVGSVLTEDNQILRGVRENRERVVRLPMDKFDRIGITVREECRGHF
jgi:hypothetical protein